MNTILFDLGAVLIDWNPRYLYRPLFKGDEAAMERFLDEIVPPGWNREIDAGKTVRGCRGRTRARCSRITRT